MQQSIHVLARRAAGSRNGEGGGDCSPSQKGQGDEVHTFTPQITSDHGGAIRACKHTSRGRAAGSSTQIKYGGPHSASGVLF